MAAIKSQKSYFDHFCWNIWIIDDQSASPAPIQQNLDPLENIHICWWKHWNPLTLKVFSHSDQIQRGSLNHKEHREEEWEHRDAQLSQSAASVRKSFTPTPKKQQGEENLHEQHAALRMNVTLSSGEILQVALEKIRFHVICAVHTVQWRKSDLSHIWAKKKICLQPEVTNFCLLV